MTLRPGLYTSPAQERADADAEWCAVEEACIKALLAAVIAPSLDTTLRLLSLVRDAHGAWERWHRVHTDAKVG